MLKKHSKIITICMAALFIFPAQARLFEFFNDLDKLFKYLSGDNKSATPAQKGSSPRKAQISASGAQEFVDPVSVVDNFFNNEALPADVRQGCIESLRNALLAISSRMEINNNNHIAIDSIIARELESCARRKETHQKMRTPASAEQQPASAQNQPKKADDVTRSAKAGGAA